MTPKFTAPLVALLAISLLSPGHRLPNERSGEPALQRVVDKALGDRAGSIVVLDVSSNKILASSYLDLAANRLVRPGSTLKPFVLMELLQSGKLDASQHLRCRRPLLIGGMRLDCAHTPAVTQLDADDAIAYSCNSYVAEVTLRLDGNELAQAFRRAGLDSVTGLVESESTGKIEIARDRAQLQLEALGQQGIDVTLLELLESLSQACVRQAIRRSAGHPTNFWWAGALGQIWHGACCIR